MGFDGVVDVERGVRHVFHAAVAGGGEEVDIGGLRGAHVVGEGSSIGLDILRMAVESFVCGCGILSFCSLSDRRSLGGHIWCSGELDVNRDQGIVLVENGVSYSMPFRHMFRRGCLIS